MPFEVASHWFWFPEWLESLRGKRAGRRSSGRRERGSSQTASGNGSTLGHAEVIDRGQRDKTEIKSYKEGKNHESRRPRGNSPKETHFNILGTGVTQVETPLPTFVFICPPVLLPSRHSKGKSLFWFRVTATLPWTPGLLSVHAIPCRPTISLACITCPWPPQCRRGTAVLLCQKADHHHLYPCGPLFLWWQVKHLLLWASPAFSYQDLYGLTFDQKTANAPPCTAKLS